MTESIRNIFDYNIKLLGDMEKAVFYFREQDNEKALGYIADSIDQINLVLEAIIKDREYFNLVDTESMLEMLTGILSAKKNRDYVLLADLLELQLINFLIGVQELIISKEEINFDEDSYKNNISHILEHGIGFPEEITQPINTTNLLDSGYRVEFSSSGLMTLAAENDGAKFYFHTNNLIQSEAFILARRWYKEGRQCYLIYGFGMGYHIAELAELAPESDIEIYEADLNVIQLASAFTDVKNLLNKERIRLVYDSDFKQLGERLTDLSQEEALLVHFPSYKNIRNTAAKNLIETYMSGIRDRNFQDSNSLKL